MKDFFKVVFKISVLLSIGLLESAVLISALYYFLFR